MQKNDFVAFGIASSHLISNIIELFLKTNRLALRKPSELSAIIKATDLKFYRLLVNYYNGVNLNERLNAARKLIDYTFKISKGDLPKYWEIKNTK